MKLEYMRLVHYVDCASNLAESIALDVKNRRISNSTVVHLGKFYAAARSVQALLDMVEVDKKDIQ